MADVVVELEELLDAFGSKSIVKEWNWLSRIIMWIFQVFFLLIFNLVLTLAYFQLLMVKSSMLLPVFPCCLDHFSRDP
jgi:hypothetical protein